MKLYNGSKDRGDIKEFSTKHTKDGYVYATSSKLVALEYMASVYPDMFMSGWSAKPWMEKYPKMFEGCSEEQELYVELIPNFFDIATSGREGWIYEFEEVEGLQSVPQGPKCGHLHCYRTKQNLKVKKVLHILDARKALQKYIDSGELKIIKYEDVDKNFALEKAKFMIDFDKKHHAHIKNNYIQFVRDYYNSMVK